LAGAREPKYVLRTDVLYECIDAAAPAGITLSMPYAISPLRDSKFAKHDQHLYFFSFSLFSLSYFVSPIKLQYVAFLYFFFFFCFLSLSFSLFFSLSLSLSLFLS
jgi:hypothetical protein